MEDFEKYLNGEMTEGERRRFELALTDDPVLQAELRVREGLRQLRLQKKVDEVAAARKDLERRGNWRWVMLCCAIAGLVGLAVFVWVKQQAVPPTPPSSQWPTQEAPAVEPSHQTEKETTAPILPEKKEAKPGRRPIAEAQPSGGSLPPPADLPNLRGEEVEAKELKNLLDQVWYAQYPLQGMKPVEVFAEADTLLMGREYGKAYAKLQRLERKLPDSDTLRILKGYCLMYMGEGADALRYFERIKAPQDPWKPLLEWYRGQCLLLAGRREEALVVFKKIAADPKHLYQSQGKTAVRYME